MAADEKTADGRSGFVDGPAAIDIEEPFVRPEPVDSLEQTWIGEGTPLGASKASLAAYRNRLERTPAEGDIEITVVCNDAAMDDERVVEASYGERADLPFDVTVAHDLTTDELADVLAARMDFLHYIGHVDDEGFACADGRLDAQEIDSVGVDAFLLNACQSYRQGMALIEAGAIGGIVTISDILNSEGAKMGRALARLLNAGFPLGSALEIARGESIMGGEYLVVGDGGLAITQAPHLQPNLCDIERDDGSFQATYRTFLTSRAGIGTIVRPEIGNNTRHYISSGNVKSFDVSKEELDEFLLLEDTPVIVRGKLNWSRGIDLESV